MKSAFWGIMISLIAISCQNQSNELNELKAEVLEVHDHTMELRGKLMQTKKELESYRTADSSSAMLDEAIGDLKAADEAMMNWMRNFESPDEQGGTDDEKMTYLEEEKQKMIHIKDQTEKSIEFAKEVASKYRPQEPEAEQQ